MGPGRSFSLNASDKRVFSMCAPHFMELNMEKATFESPPLADSLDLHGLVPSEVSALLEDM